MKKAINLATIALLLTISLSVLAGRVMGNVQQAAESYQAFAQTSENLRNQGYTMVSVQESPIYYFIAPEGNYNWGNVIYTMTYKPFENSLQTEVVTLTVAVGYVANKDGFKGTGMTQSQTTVY